MQNLKKLFCGLLALVMILGLMACGKEDVPTPPADGEEIVEAPTEAIGSFTLVGDIRLTVHYNADGNVVAIANQEGLSCHSELFGTTCAKAVNQILTASGAPFASVFLLVRQNASTLVPEESFMQNIAAEAKKALGDLPIILSTAADQDDLGYFSAETAKAVFAAYLGLPESTDFSISSKPYDGYYHISIAGASENYTVGALYGSVELQIEPDDNFSDITEEEYNPDYNMTEPYEPEPTEGEPDGSAQG